MSDASGRYSSQYHFGNGFWLGSKTLCREINGTAGMSDEDVPFPLQFYVTRMLIKMPIDIEPMVSLSIFFFFYTTGWQKVDAQLVVSPDRT